MMIAPLNPEMRKLMDRAHAERNDAIRAFFASLFVRTPKAVKAAQPA